MRLTPLGTVREKLAVFPTGRTPFPEWVPTVNDRLREALDLGDDVTYFAWELVRFVDGGTAREKEALLALVIASLAAAHRGRTRLALGALEETLGALGAPMELGALARDIVEAGELGREILGPPGDPRALIVDGGDVLHQRVYVRERSVKAILNERLAAKSDTGYADLLDAIDDVLSRAPQIDGRPRRLSTEQQHAIRTAAGRRVSVILGGPGSGKTTIVASLLRVLARLDVSPRGSALVAPTGKAARRIAESVRESLRRVPNPASLDLELLERCPEPTTIHRLLLSPRRSEIQVLIVDEASMIDLDLMARLLDAVPEAARLVFLGDPEQLPPVAPGAVFREILSVSAGAIALGESYRIDENAASGRNIRHVAKQVRSVNVEPLFHPDSRAEESIAVRTSSDELRFVGVELLLVKSDAGPAGAEGRPHPLDSFLARWSRARLRTPEFEDLARRELALESPLGELEVDTLSRLQKLLDSQQILCVTNRDVRRVNERLGASGRVMPVIALRNDRDRGRVNGESGMLVRDRVVFPALRLDDGSGGGGEAFDIASWESLKGELALAFAITVHKSQGSEYDHVALILPEADHPLASRQLLYTAVTRARKSLTLVGSKEAVIAAVGRTSTGA